MCGFCGFTGQVTDRETVLREMTERITHRGPDSTGFYLDDGIAMGFRRLSIIDLEAGQQPLYNEDKSLVLMFNGEIYNYPSLRRELLEAGHTFVTETDSEVLVHGFEEWGEALLPRLRGMFAFAIWNVEEQTLFLARDYFGIKPLHYTLLPDGRFFYASEIKSLLAHPDLSGNSTTAPWITICPFNIPCRGKPFSKTSTASPPPTTSGSGTDRSRSTATGSRALSRTRV